MVSSIQEKHQTPGYRNDCEHCSKNGHKRVKRRSLTSSICYLSLLLTIISQLNVPIQAKLADRSRIVKQRYEKDRSQGYRDKNNRPIEGQSYVVMKKTDAMVDTARRTKEDRDKVYKKQKKALWDIPPSTFEEEKEEERNLGQLTGCCSSYKSYYADDMCTYYGYDCQDNENSGNSHDSSDASCYIEGLAFIGISFSVQSTYGNPYSYQLNDQFPMENLIDRNYDYIMSMDEDGWLVGGGYKTFDYSGKMPYIDSSHTELLRVGSMNPATG